MQIGKVLRNIYVPKDDGRTSEIDAINSRYKKQNLTLPKAEDKLETEKKICPRCGAELVFRMAKRGNNAGNQFYGCSAFPKCRYIEKKTTK
ncbi:MAG: topoisomerase DNA-binding C4 zinc finger domain-containing protein [Anaerostipes sp.]|nr:topoisomerase DNA-binding C4 zinc finger domain-containing protein [Anaerostipes sp.]